LVFNLDIFYATIVKNDGISVTLSKPFGKVVENRDLMSTLHEKIFCMTLEKSIK
jgi:hypothetical protein